MSSDSTVCAALANNKPHLLGVDGIRIRQLGWSFPRGPAHEEGRLSRPSKLTAPVCNVPNLTTLDYLRAWLLPGQTRTGSLLAIGAHFQGT